MATYIDYLNDFNRWLESGNLPGGSQLMYFKLLNVFNRAGWPEYVRVDNLRMMLMIGVESKQCFVLLFNGICQRRKSAQHSKSTCNCLATRAAVTSAFSFSVLFIACCAATARERVRAGEMYGYADR